MRADQLLAEALRFHRADRLPEAEQLYRRILAVAPRHADALNLLGFLLHQTERDRQALPLYRRAIGINPDFAPFHSNLAHALLETGEREEALRCFRRATAIDPCHRDAGVGLAIVLRELGRHEESVAELRRVLAFAPEDGLAHANLGFVLLMRGMFEDGWAEMEWRTREARFAAALGAGPPTRWPGPAAASGRLLIQAEQGLGDSIQFCRYAPMAASLGLAVVLEVPEPLVRLFRSLGDGVSVIARGAPRPVADYRIPMLSLPRAFGTALDTVPAAVPYLHPDPAAVGRWAARLARERRTGLRVGLVWAGNLQRGVAELRFLGRERSLDPALLQPLFVVPGVSFVSLQKGARPPRGLPMAEVMDEVADMADTAAIVAGLDLVISVDTAVAHLAAGMGRPTWLLDRYNHDWRWLAGQERSPWYPSLRIYRQEAIGQWKPVIRRVAADLQALAASPSCWN